MAFPAPSAPPEASVAISPARPQPAPAVLCRIYRLTQGVVLGLSGATLLLYAATVGAEMRWQRQYDYLLTLRQQRQELLAATATLQRHLSQEPPPGTVASTPGRIVFLKPLPPRPPRSLPVQPISLWPLEGY